MKTYLLIFMVGLLTGCTEEESEDAKYWSYGFTSPPYYEMLIEHARSIMANNDELELMTGGGVGGFHRTDDSGYDFNPKEAGEMQQYQRADPPVAFVVGWFSVAENQFYAARVNLDEPTRQKMQESYKANCWRDNRIQYMDTVAVGLAPGGYVRAWLTGACRKPVEIGHFQGWKMNSALMSGNTYSVYKDHVKQSREDFKKEWSVPFPYEKWK